MANKFLAKKVLGNKVIANQVLAGYVLDSEIPIGPFLSNDPLTGNVLIEEV